MCSEAVALRMAAFSFAMTLKAEGLDLVALSRLERQADLAPVSCPMRAVVEAMARQLRADPRSGDMQIAWANELIERIDTLNMPAPPDLDRRDVHG